MIQHYFHLAFNQQDSIQNQLRESLINAILNGVFPENEALPSCRNLSDQLGISRNTVALVYESLLDKGYIISKPRSGYYLHSDYTGQHDKQIQNRTNLSQSNHAQPVTPPQWAKKIAFKPSQYYGILRPSNWKQYKYPFTFGQVDPQHFPINQWRSASKHISNSQFYPDWLSDTMDQDAPELIEQIRTRVLPKRGIWAKNSEILITVGAQNALYLIARLLMAPSVRIGLENPGYRDAWNTFSMHHPEISLHQIDKEGIVLDERLAQCDYVYVTPSHQVPTGVTMSLQRRQQLWEQVNKYQQIIIEDDYDADLDLSNQPLPALKSEDTYGKVIYVSSFSKCLAPGLRLGYIVADEELIDELRALRRLVYRHPPLNNQRILAQFLAQGDYDTYLKQYKHTYIQKQEYLQQALERYLGNCTYMHDTGSTSFWITSPEGMDTQKLAWAASHQSIVIEPGFMHFFNETPPENYFRLGLHSISAEKITPGIQLLSQVMDKI